MSLAQGQKASWSDILSLYSTLRTVRSKWGFSQPSDPSRGVGSTLEDTDISTLNTLVNEMRSNAYVGNTANTGITIPSAGAMIQASFLTAIQNTMTAVNNVNGANFSFGTNTSNNGFRSNGNFTFNTGNFAFGTNSGNFGFGTNTSNNGFGTNSSNHGFGSNTNNTFNSSNHGFGSNSSNNGFNANSTNVGSFVWRGSSFSSNYSNNVHRAA